LETESLYITAEVCAVSFTNAVSLIILVSLAGNNEVSAGDWPYTPVVRHKPVNTRKINRVKKKNCAAKVLKYTATQPEF
jgi:hypothetical protein